MKIADLTLLATLGSHWLLMVLHVGRVGIHLAVDLRSSHSLTKRV